MKDDLSLYERKLKEQMALLEALQKREKERKLYGSVIDLSHEILLIARELDKLGAARPRSFRELQKGAERKVQARPCADT